MDRKGETKFLIVLGGSISGLGKGSTVGALAHILKKNGHHVTFVKIDPYFNMDAGKMSPNEHGETFVTRDGAELDLDFGTYERFANVELSNKNSITTGKILRKLRKNEKNGKYHGQTIQIDPHITDIIMNYIKKAIKVKVPLSFTKKKTQYDYPEVCLIEVGGTIMDQETAFYFEALRLLKDLNAKIIFLDSVINTSHGEEKSKTIQHNFANVSSKLLVPDIFICRSKSKISREIFDKISFRCKIKKEKIIESVDVSSHYELINVFESQNVYKLLKNELSLKNIKFNLNSKINLELLRNKNKLSRKICNIAIIGKYKYSTGAYISLIEALKISASLSDFVPNFIYLDSESYSIKDLKHVNGIIIPGGFGSRGTEEIMVGIRYARENNIPLIGICFGFQLAIIEFCRNVLNIKNACSEELVDKTKTKGSNEFVIHYIDNKEFVDDSSYKIRIGPEGKRGQLVKNTVDKRNKFLKKYICLGQKETHISKSKSKIFKDNLFDRHRHRLEFNPKYLNKLESKGFIFVGFKKDKCFEGGVGYEIFEYQKNDFFVGIQSYPELTSTMFDQHPIFIKFFESIAKKI